MSLKLRQAILDRIVLRPTRVPIEAQHLEKETLLLNGKRVECFVQRNFPSSEKPELLVVKFPGTAGRAERSTGFPIHALPEKRVEVWTWNPPGYGGSEGRAKLNTIADTALELWKELTLKFKSRSPIFWLVGNSLGCLSALHIAASNQSHEKVHGLILRNPPPLIPVVNAVASHYPFSSLVRPIANSLCDAMNAMVTAPRCQSPALFFQSELDTLVELPLQDQIVNAYAGDHHKIIFDGIGHNDATTSAHQQSIAEGVAWLMSKTELN
ncbi:alpha/beta hydrolase [bacterium]|jgi:pimeloyl-ACP methyl ester carboxylesterase|nr:alpha/beta hydrolase [bacterium]MDC0295329.1 alpha/beta hydrolase [bacterium]